MKRTENIDALKRLIYKEHLIAPTITVFKGVHSVQYKDLNIILNNGSFEIKKEKKIMIFLTKKSLVEYLKTY